MEDKIVEPKQEILEAHDLDVEKRKFSGYPS